MRKYAYIFIDIDGVLNNAHTKGIKQGFCWLDDDNIAVFALFLKCCHTKYGEANVKIILSSSWRSNCFPGKSDCMSSFLQERLEKENIKIDDETEFLDDWSRGTEIAEYLLRHRDSVEHFVVIDDVLWEDFKPLGITGHWVQTADDPRNGRGGLRRRHIKALNAAMDRTVTEKTFAKLERSKVFRIS